MFVPFLALCFANIWYVDVHAPGPGNGSPGSPYQRIQYALDQATTLDGDTLRVAPGTYPEALTINKRVLIESSGGPLATVILTPPGPYAVLSQVNVGGGGPIPLPAIHGFTLSGAQMPDSGINVFGPDSFLQLEHCIVTAYSPGPAVYQPGPCYVRLRQCTIAGNGLGLDSNYNFGEIEVYGCIVRENFMDIAGNGFAFYTSCLPPSAMPNPGSFATPPAFWNASAGDYRLKPLSPCIDTGTTIFLPPDPDGSPPDVGALPYDPLYAPYPASYCSPKTNSLGCVPAIRSTGDASLSGPDNFHLQASKVLNNKPGIFLWSYGPQANAFAGGTLCLAAPRVRGAPLSSGGSPVGSDCSGLYSWHFSQAYMMQKKISAGAILYAQVWARDPGFAAPDNAQLSGGLVFPVDP